MKLLPPPEVHSKKKLENDTLIESNIRLRQVNVSLTHKLNTIKDDYEPDKLRLLKEFEEFVKDNQAKRAELLKELAGIQKAIAEAKEIYYGYIEKKDKLMELEYKISEENKKLDLRETFVLDLEKKWRDKQ